jgi:very-short-patch-repair endonuclease
MRVRQDQNRNKTVKAEDWAFQKLKETNHKWTRQAIWGCRLFDFWSSKLGIAVEIDGLTHNKNYDKARDQYNFYRSGILVLRVENYNESQMELALAEIEKADDWQTRKRKMREQFGLHEDENFKNILKKVGIKKAHGDWIPSNI